ncbi:hypothetical protein [Desertivirga brevis]|uniref:hypothetical protein n=1 Tax=Desertivirga brevis TaxID=2810310 RepID=UPI001A969F4E|nr:hypothetical protein [Pedobacter sp. SYSU D00873]
MFLNTKNLEIIVNEFLSIQKFEITSKQLRDVEAEVLADLRTRKKEKGICSLTWTIEAVEGCIGRVHRKLQPAASIAGAKILLILLDIYKKLNDLLEEAGKSRCFYIIMLRKYKFEWQRFEQEFLDFLAEREYPERLRRLALLPIQELKSKKALETVTTAKIFYVGEFQASFNSIIYSEARQTFGKWKMLCKLIELNLNHPDLEQYFYREYIELARKCLSPQQTKRIESMLKLPLTSSRAPFDPFNKSLNETLPAFISQPIDPEEFKPDTKLPFSEPLLLKIFWSVPQIGGFLFLLLKRGFFGVISNRTLAGHFASSFTSLETGKMSSKSLENNIKIEPETYNFLLKSLEAMIQDLKDVYKRKQLEIQQKQKLMEGK